MDSDEYQSLKDDIQKNGYREDLPIIIYNGGIIDGWNRYRACKELGVTPKVKMFRGNDQEAIQYIMSSNKRRNLTSSQRAAIAVEAEDIIKAIEEQVEAERVAKIVENYKERRRKILDKDPDRYNTRMPVAQNAKGETRELIPESSKRDAKEEGKNQTRTKIAEAFGTNPRYISDAKRLKKENPEVFEKIKRGEVTIPKVKKQAEIQKSKEQYTNKQKADISKNPPIVKKTSYDVFLGAFADNSIDLLITDPPYSTDVDDIDSFAKAWLDQAIPKVSQSGRAYICIGAYPGELNAYLSILLNQNKFIVDNPLIWTYRNTLGVTPKMKYNLNYQVVLHLYSEDSDELDTSNTNEMFSVQDINAPDGRIGNRFHAWQKPDELARRLIKQGSKEGDLVVDCFACTGTFLIEAAKQGRSAVGCDISHENLLIAEKRGCKYEL